MKNIKLLLSALFIVALGCNNDGDVIKSTQEVGPEIRFGSKIIQTKTIIEDEILPDNSRIGIFGWGHHKNNSGENTMIRKDLNNSLYTKLSGKEELQSDIDAHYPVSPDTLINMYAYYPYQELATSTPLNIPFDLSKQDDLMWATPITDRDKTSENDKIVLSFNHILSAITITIKKADDIKEDMLLESVSLENYSPSVNLNVQTGKLTQPLATTPFLIKTTNSEAITPTITTVCTNMLLCPVENPVFIIRLSGNNFRVPSTKAFLPGKRQTYEFTIQAADIVLSGTIKPWEDGGTSEEVIYF